MTDITNTHVSKLLQQRVSTGRYDPDFEIDDQTITELIRQTILTPSAYNLQNWRFIAVKSEEQKQALHQASYQQPQILDAAVTFIVVGQLNAHKQLAAALQPSVDAELMPQTAADGWVAVATQTHEGNPQLQMDEAFRSASLAAMTLMLAAEDMGFATGPMSGFVREQVQQAFNLSEDDIPVMLVTVGKAANKSWSQKKRRPVEKVLEIV